MGTPPHVRAGHLVSAAVALLALSGCSASAPAGQLPSAAPSSTPPPPVETCTALVSYWAKETLKGTYWSGLDWEQKGLSNEQYAIHEDAVAAGRAEERTAGRDKALELIDRFTVERCRERDGATGSSENWRPPS
ncbi:hypothetical protein [Streptomyces sp. NPDC089799]|uniref:hypothetical protein n=1 Tax=Streptomyces sp. NPDC089799 TaxID=3155066 RepID=UPI003428587F